MLSQDVFQKGMRRLSVLFLSAEKVGHLTLDVYHDALRDLTDDQFRRAVRWAERNCQFMPRPVELRQALGFDVQTEAPAPPQDRPDPLVQGVPLPVYLEAARGGDMPDEAQTRLMEGRKPPQIERGKLRRPPKPKEMP